MMTWIIGIIFSILITLIFYSAGFSLYSILIGIGFLFAGVSRKIEIGHKGVVTFLEKRTSFVLNEGIHFLPRWLGLNFKQVDCREKNLDIPAIEVLASDGIVIVDASLRYKIINPYKFLDVDLGTGFKTLAEQVLRAQVVLLNTNEARKLHLELSNHLQQECDKKSKVDWGIDVVNVWISKIDYTKEEREARQKQAKEKWESESEKTELEHVQQRVKELEQELGIPPEKAIEVVQTERGKVKKEIKEVRLLGLEKGLNINLGGEK